MNIIFPTLGSRGDVYPLIPIMQTLQKRGHRVILVANEVFRALVEEAGLSFLPLGDEQDYQRLMEDPDLWHATRGFNVIARHGILPNLRPLYKIVNQFSPHDTVIVSAALLLGAHTAYEKLGYPFAVLQLQPSLMRSVYAPPVLGNLKIPNWMPKSMIRIYYRMLDKAVIDPVILPELNTFRAEIGLPPTQRIFQQGIFSPKLNLCLVPEWFAAPQPDWPQSTVCTGFISYQPQKTALPADVNKFLQSGSAPLVFTAGTAMLNAFSFFENAVQTSLLLKRRAILLSQDGKQIPQHLPEGIIHQKYVPLEHLLPQAAAFIFHGGIGSMAQAFAAGIPQLVMPMSQDQPDNAERMRALGVGDFLRPDQFTPQRAANILDGLLNDPEILNNCKQYQEKIDFDSALHKTCDLIERLGLERQ